jgi:hypothetical protein
MTLTHDQLLRIAKTQLYGLADAGSVRVEGYEREYPTVHFSVNGVEWDGQTDEEHKGVFYFLRPSNIRDENGVNIEADQILKSMKGTK